MCPMIPRRAFVRLIAAAALSAASASASPDIIRCVGAGGGVTYQQVPCSEASRSEPVAIPTEFPAPNLAERDRLFEREAALDRRLEARRERESREAMIREAREEREAERARLAALAAQAAQPQYVIAYPIRVRPNPAQRRPPAIRAGREGQSISW